MKDGPDWVAIIGKAIGYTLAVAWFILYVIYNLIAGPTIGP